MNLFARFVIAALLALCFRGVAVAAPALYDPRTFSFGAGVSAEAVSEKEAYTEYGAAVNVFVARPMERIALVGRGSFDVKNRSFRASPGFHWRFDVAGEDLAAALTYDFFAYQKVPYPPNQWVASLLWSKGLGKHVVVSLVEGVTLDSHDLRSSLQLTFPIIVGRNP